MDFAMIIDVNPWEEHHFLTISFVLLFLPFVCFLDDALFINLNFDFFPRIPYTYWKFSRILHFLRRWNLVFVLRAIGAFRVFAIFVLGCFFGHKEEVVAHLS